MGGNLSWAKFSDSAPSIRPLQTGKELPSRLEHKVKTNFVVNCRHSYLNGASRYFRYILAENMSAVHYKRPRQGV